MSGTRLSTIPAPAVTDPRLAALDVRILAILGREQGNHGFVRLNRRQIAEWAQCAPDSVPRAIRKMERLGYLERRAAFDGKVQSANEYRVKLDTPVQFVAATGGVSVTPGKSVTGDMQDTPQVLRFARIEPQRKEGVQTVTGDLWDTGDQQKEIPPTPPKEKLSSSGSNEPSEDFCPKVQKIKTGKAEARRFWTELRPFLSESGRLRGKPKLIDRALPPIIATHGFEAAFGAAKRFYLENPDCKRDGGVSQPGLQVICNDGRLDAWVTEAGIQTAEIDDTTSKLDRFLGRGATNAG